MHETADAPGRRSCIATTGMQSRCCSQPAIHSSAGACRSEVQHPCVLLAWHVHYKCPSCFELQGVPQLSLLQQCILMPSIGAGAGALRAQRGLLYYTTKSI
jgi:hypothetical protein